MTTKKNSTIKLRSYVINDYTEETDCECCGCPLLVGERAYETIDQQHAYCSRYCAESAALTDELRRRAA